MIDKTLLVCNCLATENYEIFWQGLLPSSVPVNQIQSQLIGLRWLWLGSCNKGILTIFLPKIFSTQKNFLTHKIFSTPKIFWPKKFSNKNFFDPKNFSTLKNFRPKIFFQPKKIFAHKKFFPHKIFLTQIISWPKNIFFNSA